MFGHEEEEERVTLIDEGLLIDKTFLEQERRACRTLEQRLRSLAERTATQKATYEEKLQLNESGGGIRAKLVRASSEIKLKRKDPRFSPQNPFASPFPPHQLCGSIITPSTDGHASSAGTTPATPSSSTMDHNNGLLTMDEEDVEQMLCLIEGLEARNASLNSLLQQREEEFASIQAKFDELRSLQRALDAINEAEEAEEATIRVEDAGRTPNARTHTTHVQLNQSYMQYASPATNALTTMSGKLTQREDEIQELNQLLEQMARDKDQLVRDNDVAQQSLAAEREAMLAFHSRELIRVQIETKHECTAQQVQVQAMSMEAHANAQTQMMEELFTSKKLHSDDTNDEVIRDLRSRNDDLQTRNDVLISQLHKRDDEFAVTIQRLEEMRSTLATANDGTLTPSDTFVHLLTSYPPPVTSFNMCSQYESFGRFGEPLSVHVRRFNDSSRGVGSHAIRTLALEDCHVA